MLDVELRICQKIAKEFGLDPMEVQRIQRSQFKTVANCFRAKEGAAYTVIGLGEFLLRRGKEKWYERDYDESELEPQIEEDLDGVEEE